MSPTVLLASLVMALGSLTTGSMVCYLTAAAFLQPTAYARTGSRILFLLLASFVLMNVLFGLDLRILTPSGHVEPALAESGAAWLGSSLCCFAHLECSTFQLDLPAHAHSGSAQAE